jgi:hypothetical protein
MRWHATQSEKSIQNFSRKTWEMQVRVGKSIYESYLIYMFSNGRYTDYLSLAYRPIKIKHQNYTINTISTISNIQGKQKSPSSTELSRK